MHSLILHYAIRSTTRIAPLYHPESNPFRIAPLTFPPSQKGFCRITLNYRITDPQSSSTYPSPILFYSIHFTPSNPSNPFQLIRLIQIHSTRPEILFRPLHTSLIITPNKKRERVFSTNTLSLKIITLFQWLPYMHHSLCYSKTKLI